MKKHNTPAYTLASFFAIIILLLIILGGERTTVHHLVVNTTPASNGEPLVGDGKLWDTEFRYKFIAPEPESFKLEDYKKNHPDQVPILQYVGDGENVVVVYSDTLPDKKIFPHKLKWGQKL